MFLLLHYTISCFRYNIDSSSLLEPCCFLQLPPCYHLYVMSPFFFFFCNSINLHFTVSTTFSYVCSIFPRSTLSKSPGVASDTVVMPYCPIHIMYSTLKVLKSPLLPHVSRTTQWVMIIWMNTADTNPTATMLAMPC